MAYVLQGNSLPTPKRFTRNIVEKAVEHLIINGVTKKRITNRKEQFILEYQYLTPAQINAILALYNLEQSLTFSVSETNLVIDSTKVLMDISPRDYPMSGTLYLENMQVILTEII